VEGLGGPIDVDGGAVQWQLANGEFYRDPGADYFPRRTPAKTKARAIGQLEALGYRASPQPLTDTG
jgi:hypothetical protein